MAEEPYTIVCEPADAPLTVEGASFDRECGKCGRKVMLAPSGRRRLKENPAMKIICFACFLRMRNPIVAGAAANSGELAAELATRRPNLRRTRN